MFGKPKARNLPESWSFVLPSLMFQERKDEMVCPRWVTPSPHRPVVSSMGHKETAGPLPTRILCSSKLTLLVPGSRLPVESSSRIN